MTFNYNYYENLISKLKQEYGDLSEKELLKKNAYPTQIEIQLGEGCAGYNCKFCYGKHTQKMDIESLVSTDQWINFIDQVKHKTKSIIFAGINTDPLISNSFLPVLKYIKNNTKLKVGVHTKGMILPDEAIELLNTKTSFGDFITFSVDTVDKEKYNMLHGLRSEHGGLNHVLKNIRKLYNTKIEKNSALNINVSSLLFKDNCSYKDMEDFVNTFQYHSDRIRFTFPQIPNLFKELPDYYIKDKRPVFTRFEKLKNKASHLKNLVILSFENDTHNFKFDKCHSQKYLFAISPSGNVFPCPQVTSPEFLHLSYGNIKDQSFKDIWKSKKRKEVSNMNVCDMKCKICDRKDEEINYEVHKRK